MVGEGESVGNGMDGPVARDRGQEVPGGVGDLIFELDGLGGTARAVDASGGRKAHHKIRADF